MDKNTTRIRRSPEDVRIAKIAEKEEKIVALKSKIQKLEHEIAELKTPPITIKDIANSITEKGLDLNAVMKAIDKLSK